jgi:hypothetical protein
MSDTPMTGWAVVLPPECGTSGQESRVVVEIGPHACEQMTWTIALGWPTESELAWAKIHGAKAFRCRLVAEDEPA